MKKRFILLSLVMSAVMFLSACGSKNNGSSKSSVNTETSAPTELTMAFLTFGNTPKDLQLVQDEINKITTKKINATVKLTAIGVAAYSQQMNLMLASNEKLDLFMTGTLGRGTIFDYAGQVAKGQLYPLDELLDKYGAGIKDALGDYYSAAKVNGKIYGVSTLRDLAGGRGLVIKKDIVEKYNIDLSKVNSVADIESVLKTIKAAEPEAYPYGNGNGQTIVDSFGLPNGDMLGDMLGVLLNKDEAKVTNYYESEEYASLLKTARSWYTSKLIMPDIATTKDSAATLVKANKIYSYAMSLKPGIEGQESRLCGTDMLTKQIIDVSTDSQKVTSFMYGIPSYSQNAEKAIQFLNLMYTDKDIVNLLTYGIEGTHYAKVSGSDSIIDYAPGVTRETSGYSLNTGFEFGNQFLSYVWNGDAPTVWQDTDAMNKSAKKSVALGFLFDAANVKTEYASVSNVVSQYKSSLENGAMDPDKYLSEFISKLKDAGIDKIVAEKQKQLDAWLAANK